MWKNKVEPERPRMTTWLMHFECWIPNATDTHSEYVILFAFPLQKCLRKRASMLCYTRTACLFDTEQRVCVKKESLSLSLPPPSPTRFTCMIV
jgi:hypothetical protein